MSQVRPLHLALLVASVLLVTAGQVLLKQAVAERPFERAADLLAILASGWAILGVAAYGAGSILWLYTLSHLPFFLVTFFMVLPFALLLVAAMVLFGERPAPLQWAGIVAVLAGLALIIAGGRG